MEKHAFVKKNCSVKDYCTQVSLSMKKYHLTNIINKYKSSEVYKKRSKFAANKCQCRKATVHYMAPVELHWKKQHLICNVSNYY